MNSWKRMMMIKGWTDGAEAGLLDRHETRGSSFAYLPEVARARATSGRYAKLLPRVSCLSRRPASAPSVQPLIIIILFQEFIEGRPSRACFLQFQLKPKGGKNIGNLGISQFAQSPVLQRIERRETNLEIGR